MKIKSIAPKTPFVLVAYQKITRCRKNDCASQIKEEVVILSNPLFFRPRLKQGGHLLGVGLFFLLIGLLFQSCANIVPPSGGEKDVTEPKLLSESPKDSTLNKEVYKISLYFNKFMEVHNLEKEMSTSPLLPIMPTITAYGKKVEIVLPDSSLKANTTYQIILGNALTDNREQTPYKDFDFIFSTGSYFDSLKVKGMVTDAATGLPDSSATIFLYPAEKSDSAILKERPEYVRKVKSDGSFELFNLPQRAFKVFAVSDKDNNYIFSPATEKIDFWDTVVVPLASPDTSLHFRIFKEKDVDTSELEKSVDSDKVDRFSPGVKEKVSIKTAYRVMVDTVHHETRTFDILQPLKILLGHPLSSLDTNRINLSYLEDSVEINVPTIFVKDSSEILVKADWQPDKLHTLSLKIGWAKDTANTELKPGKFRFHTKSLSDYATLNINVDSAYTGLHYLVVLLKEAKVVWQHPASSSKLNIKLLPPGEYTLRLVIDENENGQWDTGDLFEHQHAEEVIPYKGKIMLKAGWVNDVDFKKSLPDKDEKAKRFSGKDTSSEKEMPAKGH